MGKLKELQKVSHASLGEIDDGAVAILTVSERARRIGETINALVSQLAKYEVTEHHENKVSSASDEEDDDDDIEGNDQEHVRVPPPARFLPSSPSSVLHYFCRT